MESTPSSYQEQSRFQPNIWAVGTKGGIYTGLVLIAFTLLSFLAGWYGSSSANTVFSVISYLVGIYFTHKAFKDHGDGYMTYVQGLGLGSVLSLVSGILNSAFSIVYLIFFDNTFISRQMEQTRIQLEERGMSDAEIEQALEFAEFFTSPMALFFMAVLSSLFFGFIWSLIISAFTKETDPRVEY